MDISRIKLACMFLFGGADSAVEYVLDVLTNALGGMEDATKEKVQGALNLAQRALAVLTALKWLIPTKWQTAYAATIEAVQGAVDSLSDLAITKTELDVVVDRVKAAVAAWKGEDDETCVDCVAD